MGRPLTRALLLVLAACSAPGPAATAGGPQASACPLTRGQVALDRINEIRLAHGLPHLEADARLVQAALAHTADQAARGAAGVGHLGSDGSAPGDRVAAAGYPWALVAENVAAGVAPPEAVVAGWMDSPPHRATILSADAVHAGIGHVYRFDGSLNHYWTLLVAAPRTGAPPRRIACHP